MFTQILQIVKCGLDQELAMHGLILRYGRTDSCLGPTGKCY